jgi:flagellar biogenesis protein FliO
VKPGNPEANNMKPRKEFLRTGHGFLKRVGRWFSLRSPWGGRRQRQLRLCENLALGERRFLSVVECGQQRFLLGGSPSSLVVLAELATDASPGPKKDSDAVPTYKLVGGELTKDVLCG